MDIYCPYFFNKECTTGCPRQGAIGISVEPLDQEFTIRKPYRARDSGPIEEKKKKEGRKPSDRR